MVIYSVTKGDEELRAFVDDTNYAPIVISYIDKGTTKSRLIIYNGLIVGMYGNGLSSFKGKLATKLRDEIPKHYHKRLGCHLFETRK